MTNFKKMALGLLVAVLAVGFSAFTEKSAKRNTYTFYYDGPMPATVASVEEESHWKYDSEGQTCDDAPELACTIIIDQEYVDATDVDNPVLLHIAELEAAPFASSAYVTGSADDNIVITNKPL